MSAIDPARCIKKVYAGTWLPRRQCSRHRGHGDDGLYCRQHAGGDKRAAERMKGRTL